MILTDGGKCVVMVYGVDGQTVPHGPFDTEDEAAWYLECLGDADTDCLAAAIGYKVYKLQLVMCVQLIGAIRKPESGNKWMKEE